MKDYGLPVSVALHVLILAGAIFAMPAAAPFEPVVESMPVEILTPEQFQQIAQGEETAKPDPTPRTKVEKVAPQKPVKTVEAAKVQPDATTPTPPTPPTRSVPDQQVAAAEPVEPSQPPPPPKPAVDKPQAAKPAPAPPEPPTPPEPEKPPEPVKQALQPPPKPEPKPKPVPQDDAQKLEDLALKAAQEPDQPPKPEPAKAKPIKPPPEPPKPEAAKADPKPVEKPVKPQPASADKADPKQLEKLLASLKTDAKPDAATDDGAKPAKPTPVKPAKPLDMGGLKDILNKHPSTVPAKVAAADSTDAPDALPSKEPPTRAQKAGDKPSETASLGKQDAVAPKLSLAEINALTAMMLSQVTPCWSKPITQADPAALKVDVVVSFNADGTLNGQPQIVKIPDGPQGPAIGAGVQRAILRCVTDQNPVKFPREQYAKWKKLRVGFTPN